MACSRKSLSGRGNPALARSSPYQFISPVGIIRAPEPKILITAFATWLPHQRSNASDELLRLLQAQASLPPTCQLLHPLPVCVETAYQQIQDRLEDRLADRPEHRPFDFVICCGMAESRDRLTLEAQAVIDGVAYWTPISLIQLLTPRKPFQCMEVSLDAGQFVCNGLYFRLLKQFWQSSFENKVKGLASTVRTRPAPLFVHVPPLTLENIPVVLQDFRLLLQRLLDG